MVDKRHPLQLSVEILLELWFATKITLKDKMEITPQKISFAKYSFSEFIIKSFNGFADVENYQVTAVNTPVHPIPHVYTIGIGCNGTKFHHFLQERLVATARFAAGKGIARANGTGQFGTFVVLTKLQNVVSSINTLYGTAFAGVKRCIGRGVWLFIEKSFFVAGRSCQ